MQTASHPRFNGPSNVQQNIRLALRIAGPAMIVAGVIFTVIGFVGFFNMAERGFGGRPEGKPLGRAFDYKMPSNTTSNLWSLAAGIPLIAAGVMVSRFAYFDVSLGGVIGDLVSDDNPGRAPAGAAVGSQECSVCAAVNDADAKFCDQCGAMLGQLCPQCGQANDSDAHFCDTCGRPLA